MATVTRSTLRAAPRHLPAGRERDRAAGFHLVRTGLADGSADRVHHFHSESTILQAALRKQIAAAKKALKKSKKAGKKAQAKKIAKRSCRSTRSWPPRVEISPAPPFPFSGPCGDGPSAS